MDTRLKIGWHVYKYRAWQKSIGILQRALRGYSSRDVWDTYNYLDRVIAGMCRRLAATSHGYPADFGDYEAWQEFLIGCAEGLEHSEDKVILKGSFGDWIAEDELFRARRQKARECLVRHWEHLWD